MSDLKETGGTKETGFPPESGAALGAEGIRAMQGFEPQANPKEQEGSAETTENPPLTLDESQLQPDQLPYDPAKLEYRKGSPHADYQLVKDLQTAERRHELGRQAATMSETTSIPFEIPPLVRAAIHTYVARKESQTSDETPMDDYFYEQYGRTPYTDPAYPQDEDE